MELRFRVAGRIDRPVAEVFDAVRDPAKLTQYFCDRASAPLAPQTDVTWAFDMHTGTFDTTVHVKEVRENECIVFEWPRDEQANTEVVMKFSALDGGATLLEIFESGWPTDGTGLKQSYDNCSGWTHMLCSLAAWLESDVKSLFRFPE